MSLLDVFKRWREHAAAAVGAPRAEDLTADAAAAAELNRRGILLRERAQYAEAERSLMRAVELKHDFAEAHLNLGLTYLVQGHLEDAADCFQLAAQFGPDLIAARIELGSVLARLGRFDAADAAYCEALARDPRCGEAWMRRGGLFKARGNLDSAIDCYRAAIDCEPSLAEAHCLLGVALFKAGRYHEAQPWFDAALKLRPDYAEAHHNLGLLLLEYGYPAEALARFERALTLNPEAVETRACIAHALRDLGRLDEALQHYDEALARRPDFADAVINRSYALLMREDYAAGWAEYERRFSLGTMQARGFPFAPWRGEPLAGKRILVYAEQGLGDEILFASCLPELLRVAGHCVIECSTRLAGLFERSFPQATIHGAAKNDDKSWLTQLPSVDFQVAIGSLPLHFRRARADFPARRGYLTPARQRSEFWRREFAAAGGAPRIGIAWRGGSLRTRQHTRSIPLPQWAPLLQLSGAAFYALQYGDIGPEVALLREEHGVAVRGLGSAVDDLDELAAIISALDLVVSVDNTVAHLAGALGQSVWTLLPFSPEWRYPRYGEAMPWYPSARLFRQASPREWIPVIRQIAQLLATGGVPCSAA